MLRQLSYEDCMQEKG